MKRPSIPFHAIANPPFARARVARVNELFQAQGGLLMAPPRDPTQVPPGDASDAVKENNPIPSDFNDDESDEVELEDGDDDDMMRDGEED